MRLPVLFSTPFRSWFFLGNLAAAVLLIPWLWQWINPLSWQPIHSWFWWHQHEMVYAIAVPFILGFSLTASQNWTGQSPITPIQTCILISIWLLSRFTLFLDVPLLALALFEIIPIVASALLLATLLIKHKNYRNLILVAILILFAVIDACSILLPTYIQQWAHASIYLVIVVITLFAGRVVPFFTSRRLKQDQAEAIKALEITLMAGQLMALILMSTLPDSIISRCFAVTVGLLHLVRWGRWQSKELWRIPLLWSLHLAYFAIASGWLLVGLLQTTSLGLHMLAIGGISVMIIGFSGRISLAHTGRGLNPPRRFSWAIYFILASLAFRVILPSLFGPMNFNIQYIVAGTFWIIGFGLFLSAYAKVWLNPRPDGQTG